MGFLGNMFKGVVNVVVSPLVIITDVVKGDFENTSYLVEKTVDTVEEGIEDLLDGDII